MQISTPTPSPTPAFDLKTLQAELAHARRARISAQREGGCLEEINRLMRQSWRASARLELAMRGDDPEELLPH